MPMPAMPSLSVARLSSVFEDMAGAALKNPVDDSSCVFRTQGIIGDWTAKRTFWNGVHYGIELADGGKSICVDLPLEVIQNGGIRPGDRVDVLGIPVVYLKKSVVLFKLHVHAASVIEASAGGRGPEPVKNIEGTISHLKELGFKRIPFPKRATAISVIHSKSHAANVFADFKNELDLKSVNVESLPTAMTDPSAIARAIDQASGNVVVLIRGGGDDAEFTTFQHDDVVKALARKAAHRITGLGHYGNLTYADIIADFCTTTPTSAGAYVREQLIRTYNMRQTEREALEEQAALIKALRISKLKWMLIALAGIALAGYLGFFR